MADAGNTLGCANLNAGYGSIKVLRNLTLRVGETEIVGVLGPNGSGKSTLIRSLIGLTTVYSGTVTFLDRDITRLKTYERARAGLGFVPQTENIFQSMTVQENLELGGGALKQAELREELERVYELFPVLADRRSATASALSGGERRVLSIAGSLIMRCRCLLLDEPSSDLSPKMIDVVFSKISEIKANYRVPILMVEQNVPRLLELADRLYVLVRGEVKIETTPDSTSEAELGDLFLDSMTTHPTSTP